MERSVFGVKQFAFAILTFLPCLIVGAILTPEYDLSNVASTRGFTLNAWGNCVSDAGDVNGDGISDVIIGAHWVNSNAGITVVVFGGKGTIISNTDLPTFVTGPATGFRILAPGVGAKMGIRSARLVT